MYNAVCGYGRAAGALRVEYLTGVAIVKREAIGTSVYSERVVAAVTWY